MKTVFWKSYSKTLTVTLDPNGGTLPLGSSTTITVQNGDTYSLPIPTRLSYTFNGWYYGTELIETGDTVALTEDATFVANWTSSGNPGITPPITDPVIPDPNPPVEEYGTGGGGTVINPPITDPIVPIVPSPPVEEAGTGDGETSTLSLEETAETDATTASCCKNYTYDLAGNRTGFTLEKDGETVHNIIYSYDNLNRLSTVSENGAIEASYTYDTNGNRTSLTLGNGVVTTYSYNLANWVTNLSNKNSDGAILSSYSYEYYASGNQKSKTDNTGKVTSYIYDGLGRLTSESESGGVTLSYTYDSAGNRTKLTATGTESYVIDYSYNNVNQLTSEVKTESGTTETTGYTYDANGNMLSKTSPEGTQANTYNNLNQLVSSIMAGVTSSYTYNVDGIRTSKTVGSTTTYYLLDGGNVVAESQNGEITATYLRGANLLSTDNGTSISYYLFNAHGDVTGLANCAQTVTKSYDYDAFGNEKEPSATDENPFRYCGEYFDKETGTYYLRARYYDPVIGRFTSQDSVRYTERSLPTGNVIDPLSLNYYTYSANNPVMYCDPSGNVWETVFDVISLGVSIAQAVNDPTNGWLWVGVAADAVDLIPFVTGVGEVTRAIRIADAVDNAHDAGKVVNVAWDAVKHGKKYNPQGKLIDVNESMSEYSRKYQTFVTGQTNKAYLLNGVKFDGITPEGILMEAKGKYSNFVNKQTGNFYSWFKGADSLINQANRQLEAANGNPIHWYFSDKISMEATIKLFEKNEITGIVCIYMPME